MLCVSFQLLFDDAAVRRTLVLIAFHRSHCFHVAVSVAIFLYLEIQCLHSPSVTVTLPVGDSKLLLAVTEF